MTQHGNMSGFSDEDLELLKRQFANGDCCAVKETNISSLISRLKAAEAICNDLQPEEYDGDRLDLMTAWSKSKGGAGK